MRNIVQLAVLTLALLAGLAGRSGHAADVAALIKQLDRTEWEIVSDEVSKRLPGLVASEEEQALFRKLMQSSQQVAAIANALQYKKYDELGALSASILEQHLEQMVADRYGKDSRLYQAVQLVKNNKALAKELTRAALNVDPYAAGTATRGALRKYAEDNIAKLQSQGEQYWKDMLLEVVPGGTRLAALGINPVDIYIQAVQDFSDFSAATLRRFNDTMLNCQALFYAKVRRGGGSHASAQERLEYYGTNLGRDFNCSAEQDRLNPSSVPKTALQQFLDMFKDLGSGAGIKGELNLTPSEVADLVQKYEQGGAREKRGEDFAEWLRQRLVRNIKDQAGAVTDAIAEEQEKMARQRISDAEKVMAAIEAEIAKLDRDKPKTTAPGSTGTGKPVAGKSGDKSRAADTGGAGGKGKEKEKGKPEPVKVTVQCDRLTVLVRSAERRVNEASASEAGTFISGLTDAEAAARKEGNCGANVFASAADVRTRLQQASALRARLETAVKACNIGALDSLRAEASRIAPGAFDNEITLLQTARTGVEALNAGKAAFDAGRYDEARRRLVGSRDAFREMPGRACRSHADRAQKGLDNIAEIMEQKGVVDRAINTCEIDEMKRILSVYRKRTFRFFTESSARIRAALPECEKKQDIIAEGKFCDAARARLDAARSDFAANKLKAARQTLLALAKELNAENTKRCSDLKGRVEQGLSNLDVLKAEYERLARAAKACDVDKLKGLVSHYVGEKHPWYREATVRAKRVIEECQDKPPTREEAIADCRRQVAAKGKVYATTRYKPDGTYTCHWCEQGQVSNGSACVTDVAAAEASCRRKVASLGKVYGKTEIRPGAEPLCHWCEPGQVYNNGKCGTVAAHNEAKCRQLAASRGKVYAATQVNPNGSLNCRWCEPGQVYSNGRCGTLAAHNELKCRQLAASRGKVYAATQVNRNGTLNCRWCEPGQYYANGRCYSRQQVQQPRAPMPQPGRSNCGYLPPPCHVDMSGTAAGMQRERACRARNAQLEAQYRACKARGG